MENVVVPPAPAGASGGYVVQSGSGQHHHRGLEGKDAVLVHATQTSGEARDLLREVSTSQQAAAKDRSDQDRFAALHFANVNRGNADMHQEMVAAIKEMSLMVKEEAQATRVLIREQKTDDLRAELARLQTQAMITAATTPRP